MPIMKILPLLVLLPAFLPAQTSGLQTVKADNYPLRAGCAANAEEVARLKQGDPVKIRYALAGADRPCYAVSVELNGTKVQGYVWAEALTGLDEFEQARRAASASSRLVIKPGESPARPGTSNRQPVALPPLSAQGPVPAFSFSALDTPGQIYTNDSLRGKTYLIDFWATWCPPCRATMPDLHRIYAQYKYQNFEVLSVSFDNAAEDVAKFRRSEWRMPWLHAFVSGAAKAEASQRFGVHGIPRAFLVDREGRVVASGTGLQGAYLEQMLERVLRSYQ